jgi:hypothetical protein
VDEAVILKNSPTSSARGTSIIGAFPTEVDPGAALIGETPVDPAAASTKPETARLIGSDLDEGWSNEVESFAVSKIRFEDPPSARGVSLVLAVVAHLSVNGKDRRGEGSRLNVLDRLI